MKTLLPFLFYALPEAFLLIIAALGLLGLRIRPGRLGITGLGLSILAEVTRFFLFDKGLHTPIILIGLTISLVFGFQLSWPTAVTGCFLSFFLLLMGESLLAVPVLILTKTSYQTTLANPWLHTAFGWLSAGFLVIASLVCHLGKVALIRAPESQQTEGSIK